MDATLAEGYIARPYRGLFTSLMESMQRHLHTLELVDPTPSWYLTFSAHPGPGCPAAGPSAWLEAMGYQPFQCGATLVRPHLDDVPELPLPELCASLRELRIRGMTEAALGADVDNPSAFELYQRVGFQVTSYEAVYRRPIGSA